ncbi:MAG: hypothetical protein GC165_08695 [Armatimonadetes bacterium]|nr:hypothetical protein [Armatimonadota bacterium]
MLTWENTDQFGNLKVAQSKATSLDDLDPDLRDLVQAVLTDHPDNPTFSVDVAYAEIAAPRGDQVSHILNLPFVSQLLTSGVAKNDLQQAIIDKLKDTVGDKATVIGPWD